MGLSPDCEDGKRHEKRGDVLFRACPASAEDLPTGHILSAVLRAMLPSLLPMPDSFLESRAGFGSSGHADGVPCFIEDLVVVSRDRRPAASTLRNMHLTRQKGLGQVKQWATAHQVAHTADAAVDAPTPPVDGAGFGPPGRWSPAVVHRQCRTPPCARIADWPLVSCFLARPSSGPSLPARIGDTLSPAD
jgi:hypothetical protein